MPRVSVKLINKYEKIKKHLVIAINDKIIISYLIEYCKLNNYKYVILDSGNEFSEVTDMALDNYFESEFIKMHKLIDPNY